MAGLRARSLVHAHDDPEHRHELDQPDRHRAVEEGVRVAGALANGQRCGAIADEIAQSREEPQQPRGGPDLPARNQVRNVALEGTVREVGAELEEGDESADRGDAVRGGDSVEEDHIERSADEDVWLASPPARDRVVAYRTDRRLNRD